MEPTLFGTLPLPMPQLFSCCNMLVLEVSVLSGDQLMYQSMKCEPPQSPTERRKLNIPASSNSGTTAASAGILISSTPTYKVPEASNNWKAEIKRIWNKPVEQLPIGIDLPRLANSIFVEAHAEEVAAVPAATATDGVATAGGDGDVEMAQPPSTPTPGEEATPSGETPTTTPATTPAETTPATAPAETTPAEATSAEAAPAEQVVPTGETTPAGETAPTIPPEDVDTRAREIMATLGNIGRFVEGEAYVQNLYKNFGNYVVLDGIKDRDMAREIKTLVGDFLGKESKVVKVLKACNQAIIAPAVIELTLNAGAKVPFRDAGGWRMVLSRNPDDRITVTHIKQQKQRSSNKEEEFNFEWHLEIVFEKDLGAISDVFLSIPKFEFGPAVSQSKMEGIQYTFAPYLVRR